MNTFDEPMFTVGVDLGQSRDPTAVCIVQKADSSRHPVFRCGFLRRVPLGTSYPSIIGYVGNLIDRLKGPSTLAIDFGGVGRPVFDLFVDAGFSPVGIAITAGDHITREGGNIFRVPKLTLVSRLQALLHSGQLKILKTLADAPQLVRELEDMRATFSDRGHMLLSARVGRHDDLCLSLCIAIFAAHGGDTMEAYGCFEFYREQYGGAAPPEIVPQVAEDPIVEPPPGDPYGFFIGPESAAPAGAVTLRAPPGTSAANGMSGRLYKPNAAGLFEMSEIDARPLIAHGRGWARV
jgi:hypothetical protein